jgi:hypothetical protein
MELKDGALQNYISSIKVPYREAIRYANLETVDISML